MRNLSTGLGKLPRLISSRAVVLAAGCLGAYLTAGCYAPLHSHGIPAATLPDSYRSPVRSLGSPINFASLTIPPQQDYLLGPGDSLEVTINELYQGAETRPIKVQVTGKGEINLPMIGALHVAGMSLSEVHAAITNAYAPDFIIDCRINVHLFEKSTTSVLVLGEVSNPGMYRLPKYENDVAHAIAAAGGLTIDAAFMLEVHRRAAQAKPNPAQQDWGLLNRDKVQNIQPSAGTKLPDHVDLANSDSGDKQNNHVQTASVTLTAGEGKIQQAHQSVLESAEIEASEATSSLYQMGLRALKDGDPKTAQAHLEAALDKYTEELGPTHPELATVLNALGKAKRDQGDLFAAAFYCRWALTIYESQYGQKHPHVATVVHNLGTLLQEQGNLDEARTHYLRAIAIYESAGSGKYLTIVNSLRTKLQTIGERPTIHSAAEVNSMQANFESSSVGGQLAGGDVPAGNAGSNLPALLPVNNLSNAVSGGMANAAEPITRTTSDSLNGDPKLIVRIPLRGSTEEQVQPEDITLHHGDVVVVPGRKNEVFFVVGLLDPSNLVRFSLSARERDLGAGYVLPKDRDIDVITAVAMAGYIDPIESPTTVTVHRTLPDGTPMLIHVDLIKARYNRRETVMVLAGDIIYLNPDASWWTRRTLDRLIPNIFSPPYGQWMQRMIPPK